MNFAPKIEFQWGGESPLPIVRFNLWAASSFFWLCVLACAEYRSLCSPLRNFVSSLNFLRESSFIASFSGTDVVMQFFLGVQFQNGQVVWLYMKSAGQ